MSMLFLSACGQDESQDIDWQLPLAVSNDPHSATVNQVLPEWAAAAQGRAEIVLLQKNTALDFTVQLASGMDADFQGMHFRLLGLAAGLRLKTGSYIDDKNVHNPAAFVQISRDDRQIYRGWLYQAFPELFGPDMMNWKLRLSHVEIDAVALEPEVHDSLFIEPSGESGVSGAGRMDTDGMDSGVTRSDAADRKATDVNEASMRP
ncbi:MAG: DUF2155 domain-containing protein [Mariprofundaceae bacterium]